MRTDQFGMDNTDSGATRYSGEQSNLVEVFFERRREGLAIASQSLCPYMMCRLRAVAGPTHLR